MAKTSGAQTRRSFLSAAGKAAAAVSVATGFPAIVPSSVLGATSPGNRINVGAIGVGRIARGHDIPNIRKFDTARIVAVCDLDANRVEDGKKLVNDFYARKTGKPYHGVAGYADYLELLANKDIDAVVISTPDHWHALIAIAAVEHGKDVYLQKPASLTIAEGRAVSNAVHRSGRFSSWHQQRSTIQSATRELGAMGSGSSNGRWDCPAIRQARSSPDAGAKTSIRRLARLAPVVPRVARAPADRLRPSGWLRCEQFGAGMITGWGAHHLDSAHWAMDTEHTGPVEIWGTAEFPKSGLWDVHGPFRTEAMYANGVHMIVSGDFPNGIKFIGTEGWIFVSRGKEQVTASDPGRVQDNTACRRAIPDHKSVIGEGGPIFTRAHHHSKWIECISSRASPRPVSCPPLLLGVLRTAR